MNLCELDAKVVHDFYHGSHREISDAVGAMYLKWNKRLMWLFKKRLWWGADYENAAGDAWAALLNCCEADKQKYPNIETLVRHIISCICTALRGSNVAENEAEVLISLVDAGMATEASAEDLQRASGMVERPDGSYIPSRVIFDHLGAPIVKISGGKICRGHGRTPWEANKERKHRDYMKHREARLLWQKEYYNKKKQQCGVW